MRKRPPPSDWPVGNSVEHGLDEWLGFAQSTVGSATPGQVVLDDIRKLELSLSSKPV